MYRLRELGRLGAASAEGGGAGGGCGCALLGSDGGLCTGVMAAYSVHLQATLPNATLPCDELPFTREADVVAEGLALEKGHFAVPTGSGLGIKVDMDVVERYRVA